MSRYRQVSISLGPRLTGVVKKLIIATSGIFLLTYLPWRLFHWSSPYEWFSLQPYDVLHHFYLWQLFTYLFLHADPFHLVFNMLALWMFGSDLERQWGSRRFLFYYFLTGAGAGLCDVVLTPLLSAHAHGHDRVFGGGLRAAPGFRPAFPRPAGALRAHPPDQGQVVRAACRRAGILVLAGHARVGRQPRGPPGRDAFRPYLLARRRALLPVAASLSRMAPGPPAEAVRDLHAQARGKE